MIEDRCRTLTDQFAAAQRGYELEQRLGRVQRAVGDVKKLRQDAEQAAKILTALSSRATDPEAKAGIRRAMEAAKAHRGLAGLWKQLKDDENLLIRGNHEGYRRAFAATDKVCAGLRRYAEQAWRDHARSSLSDDGPILDVFRESNERRVAKLKHLRSELLALSRATFPSKDQIEEFDQKIECYSSAFRSLGGDVPKAVRQALQAAASSDGAPIDLFSPNVVTWLQERDVVASFRVKAKSTP